MEEHNYHVDWSEWRQRDKLPGISGCFRLRNESEFMRQAVLSHLPYLDEAVLVIQPSSDNTYEIAYELSKRHGNIRVCEYPFECDWIDTPGFYQKDPNTPGHLVHMSNWALSQCKHQWICKTEGDVICLSTFENIVNMIYEKVVNDNVYIGRTLLNVAGVMCNQISKDVPRNGGFDVGVFRNDPDLWHFERIQKWEMIVGRGPRICAGWSGLHMKRCKLRNIGWNNETYVPFTRDSVRETLASFNARNLYPGSDNALGEECLYERNGLLIPAGRL